MGGMGVVVLGFPGGPLRNLAGWVIKLDFHNPPPHCYLDLALGPLDLISTPFSPDHHGLLGAGSTLGHSMSDEGLVTLAAECARYSHHSKWRKEFAVQWRLNIGLLCDQAQCPKEAFNAYMFTSAAVNLDTETSTGKSGVALDVARDDAAFAVVLQWALLCAPVRWQYCRTAADATRELYRYAMACEERGLLIADDVAKKILRKLKGDHLSCQRGIGP